MATPTMTPVNRKDFAPTLREKKMEYEWKEYNWMGRIVHWMRASDTKGLIQKTFVHTVALLVALVLMVSIVGVPLLIYATKELVRQQERVVFDRKLNTLFEVGTDCARIQFLCTRKGLFEGIEVKLHPSTRNEIIQDLNHLKITDKINKVPLNDMGDGDLLRMILSNDHNSFANYNLKVTG